ncbi:MAG: hypothetical protein F6K56_37025 [Moorea sp. SIO3G5]|nr:hypothetical protein [Moorena sp. SIO3G5]
MNTLNNDIINGVRNTQATPQTMPEVAENSKGLVTKGALLGFASPATRIAAIETCEGNVQLSYFDNQGRMRLTNFDATADSQNTTFEQWRPDQLPVALNLADSNDKIQLANPIDLTEEWTIETWFSSPLPTDSQDNPSVSQDSLESVLEKLNQNYQSITSIIPNRYDFTEGETGDQIVDGGNDMYDGGNRHSSLESQF